MQKHIYTAVGSSLLLAALFLLFISFWFVSGESDQIVYDEQDVRAKYFSPLVPMAIGGIAVEASVASTAEERATGLSGTPFLPSGVVKLFVFPEPDRWGIWMPDMRYPIDIIWLDEAARVVHIETQIHPDTYPETFFPYEPALYVIETNAGFVDQNDITLNSLADLPVGL